MTNVSQPNLTTIADFSSPFDFNSASSSLGSLENRATGSMNEMNANNANMTMDVNVTVLSSVQSDTESNISINRFDPSQAQSHISIPLIERAAKFLIPGAGIGTVMGLLVDVALNPLEAELRGTSLGVMALLGACCGAVSAPITAFAVLLLLEKLDLRPNGIPIDSDLLDTATVDLEPEQQTPRNAGNETVDPDSMFEVRSANELAASASPRAPERQVLPVIVIQPGATNAQTQDGFMQEIELGMIDSASVESSVADESV